MLIRSVGIDPSAKGSCFFELKFDQDFKITGCDYYLFSTVQKLAKASPNVILLDSNSPTVIKIDDTIADLDARYLQSNIQSVFTVERFVPSSAKSTGDDWKGIYHVTDHYLRLHNKTYSKIYPVSLKKYATGSGRAEKDLMGKSFNDNGLVKLDLSYIPDTKNPKNDPKSNVWDSYFLAEFGYYKLMAQKLGLGKLKELGLPAYKLEAIQKSMEEKPE